MRGFPPRLRAHLVQRDRLEVAIRAFARTPSQLESVDSVDNVSLDRLPAEEGGVPHRMNPHQREHEGLVQRRLAALVLLDQSDEARIASNKPERRPKPVVDQCREVLVAGAAQLALSLDDQ